MTGHRCPRCEAALVVHGATSRASVGGGGHEIRVCSRCGERELLYEPGALPPTATWPLPTKVLLEEERRLIERYRGRGVARGRGGPATSRPAARSA